MLPVLLDFYFIKIYTYGVFLMLAFFWGSFLLWKNIQLTSYKEDRIFDALFLSLGGGLILGRIVHILFNFEDFGFNILRYILINGFPGISLFGFLIGGFLTLFVYCSINKINFFDLIDYVISPVLLAIGIGKIGSFLSGVEVGTQTQFFLSIKYANFEGFRHLTAFYEGLLYLFGAFIGYKLLYAIRRQKYEKGVNWAFFWWFFSLIYFLFDSLKMSQVVLFGQSVYRVTSLIILLTGTVYFLYYFRYLIFRNNVHIKNSVKKHGTNIFKRFSGRAATKTYKGEGKHSASD